MRETTIERYLKTEVEKLGGMCVKLMPLPAGIPDRMVLLPGGRSWLVELKQPQGKLSKIQEFRHTELYAIGHTVTVLWSKPQVDAWLANL